MAKAVFNEYYTCYYFCVYVDDDPTPIPCQSVFGIAEHTDGIHIIVGAHADSGEIFDKFRMGSCVRIEVKDREERVYRTIEIREYTTNVALGDLSAVSTEICLDEIVLNPGVIAAKDEKNRLILFCKWG